MNIEQMKSVLREILLKTDLTPCVVGLKPQIYLLQTRENVRSVLAMNCYT